MQERKPIFYDERRRRWWVTRRVLEISGAVFIVLLVTFFITVVRKPNLPALLLPDVKPTVHALRETPRTKTLPPRKNSKRRVEALEEVPQKYDPIRAAFFVPDDPSSMASLKKHYRDLDILMAVSLGTVSPDGRLDESTYIERLYDWMKGSKIELPVMSVVQNSDGTTWRTTETSEMMANVEARTQLIHALTNYVLEHGQMGIVLDFEDVADKSQRDFSNFIAELGAELRGAGLKLMVALPAADWNYDYATIAKNCDAVILMNYDEHWLNSPPGPIAGQEWFLTNLFNILKIVPREKLMMGIANYAYDWPDSPNRDPREAAKSMSTQEALLTAYESESEIEFDDDSLNPHFSYSDEHDIVHRVWMLDGVTAYNQLRASERAGVLGTTVWRLGEVDGSIWSIWDTIHPDSAARAKLEEMQPGPDLIIDGSGDIWKILSTPQSGTRKFEYDAPTDTIVDEQIEKFPLSYHIEAIGAQSRKIALSFDDGPDPKWTPMILDVLKEKHAPATFFVIGEEANKSPDILKREYAEGHEIGNHTYTHPHFEDVPHVDFQVQWQLNLTQLLFESTLGIKTLFFRPPYGIDHQPETADEVALLPFPQSLGYMLVGARIDPHDWGELNGQPPPSPQKIADSVVEQAVAGGGNIVLLHDGGGDRHRTVEALPSIIDGLRAAGIEIVPASDLIGMNRAQVMPPLNTRERLAARADGLIFYVFHWLRLGIAWTFIVGIVLVSCRALVVGLLALIEKLRPDPADHPEYQPSVSVLIPAFNEEDVIVATVGAALASDYPKIEVVVVNDGSVDRTSELLEHHFGGNPRVRIVSQANRGKPAALSRALGEASGDIVVTIDADTEVEPHAIRRLIRHFADARVGAVAGNVKVGNRDRWLTRWQALEYITSQNLEKRAFDLLNCIIVVPGAVSAWRASAIRDCGGFSADTVAEDTDLTIAIRRAGWRILYDETAVGYTQAPETAAALVRQRFRWTYGTLQSVWKHRATLGRWRYGTLGWIALPNVFLFQILFPLVSPIIDLLFLGSLVLWGLAQFHGTQLPQLWTAEDVQRSLIFFLAFMLIDFFTCVIAFALERHEEWSLLWPLLIQRFYYRQMMYVVLFRSLVWALQGHPVGWRGVEPRVPTPVAQA